MNWNEILKRGYVSIGAANHDVTHLRDCSYEITIPKSSGHSTIRTRLYVRYSSHCVSIGAKNEDIFDFNTIGNEYLVQENGRADRKFCPVRHEMSTMLPTIFGDILCHKCFFASSTNFMIIEYANGKRSHNYLIFFSVSKEANSLRVYVESAYPDEVGTSQGGMRSIGMKVVLAKRYRKEAIKRPPLK